MISKNALPLAAILGILCAMGCKTDTSLPPIPSPQAASYVSGELPLDKEAYRDKILGALVGSAIGDAMGTGTEMWHRVDIQRKYGYITGLPPALINQSPEGPWAHNMPPGTTTDDTRWKYLMTAYLIKHGDGINASNFARFIVDYYENEVNGLSGKGNLLHPDSLDVTMERIDWIKEWTRVALSYEKEGAVANAARDRFYGGEMSCAGLLYTPMFGLVAPDAKTAYEMAYAHTLFDIGYARDISSLASAMCHMALRTQNMDSILKVHAYIDPYGYLDSRLVGRIAHNIANTANDYVLRAKEVVEIPLTEYLVRQDSVTIGRIPDKGVAVVVHKDSIRLQVPEGYPGDDIAWYRQQQVYWHLEQNQRMIAFHAGEIWEILHAGLTFGEGDFLKSLQFIINYGRDNDTVGALAGMILGTHSGFKNLPDDLKYEAIRVNRELLGIDLEDLAQRLVQYRYPDK